MDSKEEILQQWLDKGKDDLKVAEYLSAMHHPTPDEIIITLKIGSDILVKNGENITLDVPAQIIGDRTIKSLAISCL